MAAHVFQTFLERFALKGLKEVSMARTIKEDKCDELGLNTSLLNISPKVD